MKQEIIQITEENKYSTKDIAKYIRQTLKKDFPKCKFSITIELYSGGSSINAYLMESDRRIKKTFSELTERAIFRYKDDGRRTEEQLKSMQESDNHQLNQFCLREDYDEDNWNNGVFLTKEGHELLKKVDEIVNKYNYDNSDSMTDYFDVNYYVHFQLGKCDKPFIDGE